MTRVLILDADATLTSAVARCLGEAGIEVVEHNRASTVRDALDAGPFDFVLLDWLFSDALSCIDGARVIVMLSYADPAEERALAQRFRLIRKPFKSVELLSLLEQDLGPLSLRPPGLLDALRSAHASRSTTCLVIGDGAEVHVIAGEIHDARCGTLRGHAALRAMLTHKLPAREVRGVPVAQRTVRGRMPKLLLDLLGEIDDAEQGR